MKHMHWVLVLAVACGGGEDDSQIADPSDETTTGDETTTEVSRDPLVIAAFTMTDSGGQAISMSADGQLTMEERDRPGPLFESNGNITMDGDPLGTITADGTFTASTGEQIAVIAEDGSTTVGGRAISWAPDGTLTGGNPDGPSVSLSPADSPAKRAATAVLLMMTMTRPEPEPAGPVEEPAVEPAP